MEIVKKILRSFLPQKFINISYHLPLAFLANIFYDFPGRELKVIGVTGTDGKTTTVNMIYQILVSAGKKVSMVSTINAVVGGKLHDTGFHVTSPDPLMVQRFARQAKESGDEYLVLEVTSHALDQYRFWGIKFDVGVITNITHEHLDYHGTWENYFKAKAKLIKDVKVAVLNRDEKHFQKLSRLTNNKVVSFGLTKSADFNPKKFPSNLKIPGSFNILNALAAQAVCSSLGLDEGVIRSTLANFHGLPGRMEEVKNNRGIKILIDFAHTTNALEQALKTLRGETDGRLIAVFGCAGKRDIEKRARMGEISARIADLTVITAEDPRGELEIINQQITDGAKRAGAKEGKNFFILSDRAKAINFAINNLAKKGDSVGIFGKGHEQSMNLDGRKEIPWSDEEAVKKVIARRSAKNRSRHHSARLEFVSRQAMVS